MENLTSNRKLLFSILLFVFILIVLFQKVAFANMDERRSIVKIYTVSAEAFYQEPWTMDMTESSSGSGCVIEGSRILTNAHVVSDQTFLEVGKL